MKPLSLAILCLLLFTNLHATSYPFLQIKPIEKALGFDTIPTLVSVSLYPNPSSNWVFIKHPLVTKKDALIVITDFSGNLIQKIIAKNLSTQTIINIGHLPTGVYLVTWINGVERGTARLSKE